MNATAMAPTNARTDDSDDSEEDDGPIPAEIKRQLVALNIQHEKDGTEKYYVSIMDVCNEAGIPLGNIVSFNLDTEGEEPMFILAHEGGEKPDLPGQYRTISKHARVYVPKNYLRGEKEKGLGLGLDLEAYSNDKRLFFEPMVGEEMIALVPRVWEDGFDFATGDPAPFANVEAVEAENDDGVERIQSSDAINPVIRDRVCQEVGIEELELIEALEEIEEDSRDLVADLDHPQAPLDVVDKVVHVIGEAEWETIADEYELDDDVAKAAQIAHERQAEEIIREARARDYRAATRDFSALVLSGQ